MHWDKSDTEGCEPSEMRNLSLEREHQRERNFAQRELETVRTRERIYTAESGGRLIDWTWNGTHALPQLSTTLRVVWLELSDGTRKALSTDHAGWTHEGEERWLREYYFSIL